MSFFKQTKRKNTDKQNTKIRISNAVLLCRKFSCSSVYLVFFVTFQDFFEEWTATLDTTTLIEFTIIFCQYSISTVKISCPANKTGAGDRLNSCFWSSAGLPKQTEEKSTATGCVCALSIKFYAIQLANAGFPPCLVCLKSSTISLSSKAGFLSVILRISLRMSLGNDLCQHGRCVACSSDVKSKTGIAPSQQVDLSSQS